MTQLLQQLINGLSLGAIYALIAVGYTMVYGVLRFINFAHGEVFMVGAVTGLVVGNACLQNSGGEPSLVGFLLVLLASMLVCGALGFLIELLAYRPLRCRPRLTVLITAIGVSLLLQYGFQNRMVFGPDARVFPEVFPWSYDIIDVGDLIIEPIDLVVIALTLILATALACLLKFTRTGMAIRACSFRFDTTELMGINVNRVISITFVIGSMMAAAAGVLWATKFPKVDPLMGMAPGIKAFVAAVLGGIGNIYGALLGGIMLGLIEVLVVGYLEDGSQYRDAVAFVILIGMLLLRPSGLLGRNFSEKV